MPLGTWAWIQGHKCVRGIALNPNKELRVDHAGDSNRIKTEGFCARESPHVKCNFQKPGSQVCLHHGLLSHILQRMRVKIKWRDGSQVRGISRWTASAPWNVLNPFIFLTFPGAQHWSSAFVFLIYYMPVFIFSLFIMMESVRQNATDQYGQALGSWYQDGQTLNKYLLCIFLSYAKKKKIFFSSRGWKLQNITYSL